RRLDSGSKELACPDIRVWVATDKHAKGDLRLTAVKRLAERTAANIPDRDDVAGFGADVDEIAAVNPRVTASKTVLTAPRDDNGWNGQENSCFQGSGFRVQGSRFGSGFKVQGSGNQEPCTVNR